MLSPCTLNNLIECPKLPQVGFPTTNRNNKNSRFYYIYEAVRRKETCEINRLPNTPGQKVRDTAFCSSSRNGKEFGS